METFRKNLQTLREKKRISRIVASELCGLASDSIRKYERGEREPSLSSLIALAEFFDVSVDELIGRKDNEVNKDKSIRDTYEGKKGGSKAG